MIKTKHKDLAPSIPQSMPVILPLEGLGRIDRDGTTVLTPPTNAAAVIFCMIQFFLTSDDETGNEFFGGINHRSLSDLALICARKVCSKQRCCLQVSKFEIFDCLGFQDFYTMKFMGR
jgi:hypothetical protein